MSAQELDPQQVETRSQTVSPHIAVNNFAQSAYECLSGSSLDNAEDLTLVLTEDMPADLQDGNLEQAQRNLEAGGWLDTSRDTQKDRVLRDLNSDRRDALAELHMQANDGSLPEGEDLEQTRVLAQKTLLDTIHYDLKDESNNLEDRRRLNNTSGVLFGAQGNSAEKDEALTYLEGIINDISIVEPDNTEKLEALRITRDKVHEQYKFAKEIEDNQAGFASRITELVGKNNPDFNVDEVYRLSSNLVGLSAANMDYVLQMAESSDLQIKMDILLSLRNNRIPIHDEKAFTQWRERQSKIEKDKQKRENVSMLENARGELDSIYGSK